MTETKAKRLQLWIGIGVSVACIGAIFWFIDPVDIWERLQSARFGFLLITAAGIALFQWLRAFRWRFLLQNDASFSQLLHVQNIGYMLSMLLPFRLGDVARAVLVGRLPESRVTILRGASTMVVERILDLLFFVVLLPITVAGLDEFPDELRVVARIAAALSVGGIIVMIVAANQRPLVNTLLDRFLPKPTWRERINELLDGLHSLTNLRSGLILICWSIIIWIPVFVAYDAGLRSVSLSVPPLMMAFTVCCAAFGVAAPSSPGQLGVFHAAVVFGLATVLGYPEATAVGFAILYHATQFVTQVTLGVVGLNRLGTTWGSVVTAARRGGDRLS